MFFCKGLVERSAQEHDSTINALKVEYVALTSCVMIVFALRPKWVLDMMLMFSIIRNMSNYEIKINSLAEMFKALSNPHRLALFSRLMNCCEPGTKCGVGAAERFCVGELGEGLDIAPSTLSHHLKELNRAGLIQMERCGKNVECWLDPSVLTELSAFFKK